VLAPRTWLSRYTPSFLPEVHKNPVSNWLGSDVIPIPIPSRHFIDDLGSLQQYFLRLIQKLFNHCLACRMAEVLLRRVLSGHVMARWPFGGLFVAEDVAAEQARLEAREIVPAGPMFGRKMFRAAGEAALREEKLLQDAGLTWQAFSAFGKLLSGTRSHNLVYVDDLTASLESEGVRLSFTLPAGSYATVLLREFTKNDRLDADEET